MQKFLSALCLTLAFSSGQALASQTYNYSYTFDTKDVVSGSFTGVANGNLITNLSNITASVNGVAFDNSGSLYSVSWDGYNSGHPNPGTAVVSFDGQQSNFIFASTPVFNTYFYVIPWINGNLTIGAQALSPAITSDPAHPGLADYYNGNYNASNWHVAAVPEPTESALMLSGMGLLGFIVSRRNRSA
jgi:hypothetical protein